MTKQWVILFSLLLVTSGARSEEYQLPAEINNPNAVAVPTNSDSVQTVTSDALANSKPTADLPSVKLSEASSSSSAVNSITNALTKNPTIPGNTAAEGTDEYGRPVATQIPNASTKTDKAELLYTEAKKRYQEVQKVNVPPGGNIVLPISRGLQNRITTTFKNASVSTSSSPEDSSIFVDGGAVYITTNSDKPIGIMLSEDQVPESTYNLTLIPLDVPGAMISVNTALSPSMQAKREKNIDTQQYQEMLERSQQIEQEKSDPKQDDHKQRIIDLLTPVALGEVPSGFTLQTERLSRIPVSEQKPCHFPMYASLGQRLVGARELIDIVLVKNDMPYGQLVPDQQCIVDGVLATAIFDKAFLQPGEETELYIVRDKLYQERMARVTTRPSLIKK
ncbi:IncF plasmid conjugative transfer pilus assembly protein TraK [Enterobacter hormaechei]|uniref:TraK domain-containing protein n=1 Tax=Enterobacteriaceae TaxID=543 RepID=UPI000981A003|nr:MULTISPECIES: type-F conjugative transfer system secretin TraK [Enterobacteriaceae]MDU1983693.1 type-F conjugative transfer system secretin TraK [Streptococcus parasanguinis]MCE9984692.1 type-F conjugative transfer system secretin TraK [Leclercia adecarboxylata]OOB84731.1 TrhK [Leclercia adecarboxylata]VAE21401.1 IncF plasmid conjugative transfer pilus assembly protein TraK [Enterobacter hormaechei]VAE27001.1 IncF plasmid conjugative transfer pilus assembly protein TraK [Enterobacter hormae